MWLSVALGSLPLLSVEMLSDWIRIGRERDNEIVLSLPEVADHHATIVRSGDQWLLKTLPGETVFLKGSPVTEALLSEGEIVAIGGYRLQWFRDIASPEVPGAGGPRAPRLELTEPLAKVDDRGREKRAGPLDLCVLSGRDAGMVRRLDRAAVVVGRDTGCDLAVTDPAVSGRHFSVEPTAGGTRVRDLGSRNGTYLDGHRIESALALPGSVIVAGNTTIELRDESEPLRGRARTGIVAGRVETGLAELTGHCRAMQEVYARVREAAASRLPVLILGATGTGKEYAARSIHSLGPRAARPFVPINCTAVPKELLESELFGHTSGAFTGASSERRGAFVEANGGTILLDEISELPLDIQPKLLRVLEDGQVPRLGGGSNHSDFRVIAASNRDLARETVTGRFRSDLYFRLAVHPITMPPLADRLEDLQDLLHAFLVVAEDYTGVRGAGSTWFDASAMKALCGHSWPGNLRELRNLVMRAVVCRAGGIVDGALVEELLAETELKRTGQEPDPCSLEEVEREAICNALRDCHGQRRAAARRLGIAESTLYEKLHRYRLEELARAHSH
jgi:DNA-binding NtrC family response regulator